MLSKPPKSPRPLPLSVHRQLLARALSCAQRAGTFSGEPFYPLTDVYGRVAFQHSLSGTDIRFILDLDALTPTLLAYASPESTNPQTWRFLGAIHTPATPSAASRFLRRIAYKADAHKHLERNPAHTSAPTNRPHLDPLDASDLV